MSDEIDYIFISYSKEDAELMRRVHSLLEDNNLKTWTDEQLPPDTPNRKDAIRDALDGAGVVIAILSPEAKESSEIQNDIHHAIVHDILVYPLLLRGDNRTAVPQELSNPELIDISDAQKYKTGMQELIVKLLFREQLRLLTESIPTTYFMGVVMVDGLRIGAYATRGKKNMRNFAPEDRVSAMSAAMLSLGERIVAELRAGGYKFGVQKGKAGTIFQIMLGDDNYVLTFGVAEVKSIDAVLTALQQHWQPLLTKLNVSPPELY